MTWAACSAPKTYGGLVEGPHTFEVRAKTALGDTDPTPAAADFTVDTTAPSASIAAEPADPSASPSATFSFSGSDPGGSGIKEMQCSLAGSPFAKCSAETAQSYTGLPDGSHTFEVRAVDKAGNTGPAASYAWVSDTTAPETTITSGPQGPIAATDATFGFDSTEAGSFECRLDSNAEADWTACVSPTTYSELGQGGHTFEVRATDALGNVDATPAQASFSVDTIPPEIVIGSGPDGSVPSKSATFSFDSSQGSSFECRLDSSSEADWEPCTSPITYSPIDDGPHSFEVRAKDDLGNTADPAVAKFSVDTQAPETTITAAPTETISAASALASFEFAASEPGSFECRLDAAPSWSKCTSPSSYGGLAQGAHTFEVRATDEVGNVDPSPATAPFLVETPVNGERIAVAPVSGKVRIQTPGGGKFRPLLEGETIPVSSIVDTTEGKARLVSINAEGEEQSAAFSEGIFRVGQRLGRSLVTLKLRGGDLGACGGAEGSASTSARHGRHLWGSGHGNFRTEGSYGSATVRGTTWLTEDTCEGTFFKVRRGLIAVRDYQLGKTILVPGGKSYLAQGGG